MNQEELLSLYLNRLGLLAEENLHEDSSISVIEALKKAIISLEGEMQGY
jgi:hypothetical protein